MLNNIKDQLKTSVETSTRLMDECAERQVKFTSQMMESGLENAKKLRTAKTVNEAVETQMAFLNSMQGEIAELNKANTQALKELRDFASEIFGSLTPSKPESK